MDSTPVDRDLKPHEAMRAWLVAERHSDPVSVYLLDRHEVQEQIREHFIGGINGFFREYEARDSAGPSKTPAGSIGLEG